MRGVTSLVAAMRPVARPWAVVAALAVAPGALAKPASKSAAVQAESAKPGSAPATASANLRRARATVDKLNAKLGAMVKQVEAPGVDLAKVQALVAEFQAQVAAHRKESDAVEALLSEDEKADVGRYIAEKVAPVLARFEAAYKRAQDLADPGREARQQALLAAVDAAGQEATALIALARAAGADAQKRAAVIAKLEPLQVAQHRLYHAGLAELHADAAREKWDSLFAAQLEQPLLRVERVLRMGLQAPGAAFAGMRTELAQLSADAESLHGQWHAAQDWPAVHVLEARDTALRKSVQGIVERWRLLAADEADELDAQARESLLPAMERMSQDAAAAHQRLPAESPAAP